MKKEQRIKLYKDFKYIYIGNEVEITKVIDVKLDTVFIPSNINGKNVVSIGPSAFTESECLKILFIPKEVSEIKAYAFSECIKLESIVFEEESDLERIEKYSFKNCKELISICLPRNLKWLDERCFVGCNSLKEIKIDKRNTVYMNYKNSVFTRSKRIEVIIGNYE